MSDCCSSKKHDKAGNQKRDCPVCHQKSMAVSLKTMLHHLKKVWEYQLEKKQYYFCADADCEVVYFSDGNSVINKADVRTQIGIKEKSAEALLCYCFGVSKKDAKESRTCKQFVIQKTKESVCSCDTENPSGRCCLKDFASY